MSGWIAADAADRRPAQCRRAATTANAPQVGGAALERRSDAPLFAAPAGAVRNATCGATCAGISRRCASRATACRRRSRARRSCTPIMPHGGTRSCCSLIAGEVLPRPRDLRADRCRCAAPLSACSSASGSSGSGPTRRPARASFSPPAEQCSRTGRGIVALTAQGRLQRRAPAARHDQARLGAAAAGDAARARRAGRDRVSVLERALAGVPDPLWRRRQRRHARRRPDDCMPPWPPRSSARSMSSRRSRSRAIPRRSRRCCTGAREPGGCADLPQRLRARLGGRRFDAAHGAIGRAAPTASERGRVSSHGSPRCSRPLPAALLLLNLPILRRPGPAGLQRARASASRC